MRIPTPARRASTANPRLAGGSPYQRPTGISHHRARPAYSSISTSNPGSFGPPPSGWVSRANSSTGPSVLPTRAAARRAPSRTFPSSSRRGTPESPWSRCRAARRGRSAFRGCPGVAAPTNHRRAVASSVGRERNAPPESAASGRWACDNWTPRLPPSLRTLDPQPQVIHVADPQPLAQKVAQRGQPDGPQVALGNQQLDLGRRPPTARCTSFPGASVFNPKENCTLASSPPPRLRLDCTKSSIRSGLRDGLASGKVSSRSHPSRSRSTPRSR